MIRKQQQGCREQQETTIVELPRLKTTGTRCMCLEVGSRRRKTKQNRRRGKKTHSQSLKHFGKVMDYCGKKKSDRTGVIEKHMA